MSERAAEVKAEVRRRAGSLGFELVGFTTPDPPSHLGTYQLWLQRGHHGQMGYMASEHSRAARADPTMLLPGCGTILVLGARYSPPDRQPVDTHGGGKVAAYAVGDDYHDILIPRLEQLAEVIQEITGRSIAWRSYTDTGPILEREIAQRAGLGWIGKNTMLINPLVGSYFFLAELLLDIELPPDEPVRTDHCGSCTRCIEACPTGCIRPDRTIEAPRCISYLTIELRGDIPTALRGEMQDWLFGCDVCQQVCPWNQRFATKTDEPAFQPRAAIRELGLPGYLELDQEEYRRLFKGSPIKRAKRHGLTRNAAVVAGNLKDSRTVHQLTDLLLSQPDRTLRSHAAWALGCIGTEVARQTLQEALNKEDDAQVRTEIELALAPAPPG